MKDKLVIYTCVTGAYDVLEAPAVIVPWAEFIVFGPTDMQVPGWQLRPLAFSGKDNTQTARWHKLHPDLLFPEYEFSLWMDGNVSITGVEFFDRLQEMMQQGCLWGGIHHPFRDDVYEESLRLVMNDREKVHSLRRVVKFLRREGFPRHWGLDETNLILRRHNDRKVLETDRLWWKMLELYSNRDQMTHTYCLFKTGLKRYWILPQGQSVRNCPSLKYSVHGKPYSKRLLKDAFRKLKVMYYRCWLGD